MENDSDFDDSNSSDSENVIDSDFDIDENQAVPDDEQATEKTLEEEERESRRKKSVYKDPKARDVKQKVLTKKRNTPAPKPTPSTSSSSSTPTTRPPPRKKAAIVPKSKSFESDDGLDVDGKSVSRSLRKSTQKSSQEVRDMLNERKRQKKNKKKVNKNEYRQLTQEEMLREAKKTEVENTKSLEAYKNLEIERAKKVKPSKQMPKVPMIRYHSYTEFDDEGGSVSDSTLFTSSNANSHFFLQGNPPGPKKVSRTIITFPSEESLLSNFPGFKTAKSDSIDAIMASTSTSNGNGPDREMDSTSAGPTEPSINNSIIKPTERRLCPITGQPAKYFDPVTQTPYANQFAFKVIRYQFIDYLQNEFASMKDDPQMVKYIKQIKTNFSQNIKQYQVQWSQGKSLNKVNTGITTLRSTTPKIINLQINRNRRPVKVIQSSVYNAGVPITGIRGIIGTTVTSNLPITMRNPRMQQSISGLVPYSTPQQPNASISSPVVIPSHSTQQIFSQLQLQKPK